MELSYNAINAYKTLLTNPKNHGFEFKPIQECFEEVEEVTPKHMLEGFSVARAIDIFNTAIKEVGEQMITNKKGE